VLDLEILIEKIRENNPKIERDSVSNFKEMQRYLKHVDLPDSFADILRSMWDVVECKSKDIESRLSDKNNSIEVYHELAVGYSLLQYCMKHSLKLLYSPKLMENKTDNKTYYKTPDWVVRCLGQEFIVEVTTKNKSLEENDLGTCLSLIILFVERELEKHEITMQPYYNWSRLVVPAVGERDNIQERCDRYTLFCKETADRVVKGLRTGLYNDNWLEDEKSGLEVKNGLGLTHVLTTRGHETVREIRRILDKGKKYEQLSKERTLIVAIVGSHWNRSKAYHPEKIAKLMNDPNSVFLGDYSRINEKEKFVKEIKERKKDLKAIDGLLFYKPSYDMIEMERAEYYPVSKKGVHLEKTCSYLNTLIKTEDNQ
jgi:hypothetical protein